MYNFTEEDIKNSVEYQWRLFNIKRILLLFLIVTIITSLIPIIVTAINGVEYIDFIFIIWFIYILVMGLILVPFIVYFIFKNKYLIKNYKSFKCYEVVLDTPSTSYAYKASVYYSVKINVNNEIKKVETNPYFSSSVFSKFALEEYNNKTVIGLYDNKLEKFYIIKTIN